MFAPPITIRNFFEPLGAENTITDTKQKKWDTNTGPAVPFSQTEEI
jgi:hypothetical protein